MPQIKKTCICGKDYLVYPYRAETTVYCSRRCTGIYREHKKGYKCPKGSEAKKGDKNPMWVGDKITYSGVHAWIHKKYKPAKEHECSEKDDTCKGMMEWANISGDYKRDISDWKILCRSHHRRFDGAIPPKNDNWKKNFKQFRKS